MSKRIDISVLVAARDEYIEQLKCIVCPLILQGVNSIYQDALEISEGKKTLYKFQELLREIPKWNQTILQEESKRIKRKCPYIMDIVTAIFVSNVKILASIRLKGKNENIRVKIPTSDIFIHSIYIESGHQIFYNPYLFYHKNNTLQKNKKDVFEIIRTSIDETIRQMLPFDNILQEYLANALNDNADNASDTESEQTISDSDEDSLHGNDLIGSEDSEEESEEGSEHNIRHINTNNNNVPINNVPFNNNNEIPVQFNNQLPMKVNNQPPVQFNENNISSFEELRPPQQSFQQKNETESLDSSDSESSDSSDSEPEEEVKQVHENKVPHSDNMHSFF